MSQESKLNRIITQLYFYGHLRALHETEVFEPFWDETAKLMIMSWAVDVDEDMEIDDALEMAMECSKYQSIAAEHDRDLPKDHDGLERG